MTHPRRDFERALSGHITRSEARTLIRWLDIPAVVEALEGLLFAAWDRDNEGRSLCIDAGEQPPPPATRGATIAGTPGAARTKIAAADTPGAVGPMLSSHRKDCAHAPDAF